MPSRNDKVTPEKEFRNLSQNFNKENTFKRYLEEHEYKFEPLP